MFWQKYVEVCEKNGVRPRKVAAEIGVADATVFPIHVARSACATFCALGVFVPKFYVRERGDIDAGS